MKGQLHEVIEGLRIQDTLEKCRKWLNKPVCGLSLRKLAIMQVLQ